MSASSRTTAAWRGVLFIPPKTSAAITPVLWIVVTAIVAFAPFLGLGISPSRQLVLVCFLCLMVSGLNLSYGFAGELSFASPAFYALGSYVTVIVTAHWVSDLAVCLVVGIIGGLLLGLISGVPGLRLGGWMLAVTSFFLILLIPDVVSIAQKWTGGYEGANGIPLPSLFGTQLSNNAFITVVVVVTALWFAVFRNLVKSRVGDSLSVLRESPILAGSLGISVYRTKLTAYAMSGIPASIAGVFFAYLLGFVAPQNFDLTLAITVLAGCILGGSRSIYGAIFGGAIMQLGPNSISSLGNYALIFYGGFLILMAVVLPGGAAGLARAGMGKLRRLAGDQPAGVAVPAPAAAAATAPAAALPSLPGQVLAIEHVSKSFGGNTALSDVSFVAKPGEIVALIGPNGSGKTTLLNIVSGYYKLDEGSVEVGGRRTSGLSPSRIANAGVARTFQTPLVAALSVRQNVAVARARQTPVSVIETVLRLPRFWRGLRKDRVAVSSILAALGLSQWADAEAQALPLGTRRVVELARALASLPSVLLLDEVASGLDEEEVAGLSATIRSVAGSGGTVVLVEHNFNLVRDLADRVVVLSRGKVVVADTPEVISRHPEVLRHYLGQKIVPETVPQEAGGPLRPDQGPQIMPKEIRS
jgi:branched-chain amino acid transport system permease protein